MMRKRRRVPGLSYANVVATLALFVALGGSAYAVKQLPKDSVGSRQIRRNAVRTGDIARNAVKVGKLDKEAVKAGKLAKNAVPTNRLRNNAVTGAKVNEATLGTVPAATAASTADTASAAGIANSLSPSEGWHVVGVPGEPGFQNSWVNEETPVTEPAAFYKDHEGIVHLRGFVMGGTDEVIFQLPPGYRPATGKRIFTPAYCAGGSCTTFQPHAVIEGTDTGGMSGPDGAVQAPDGATYISLNGIDFRAES